MDAASAEATATELLGSEFVDGITTDQWSTALAASAIPDVNGHWPADQAWIPTYDAHWVAAEVVALRALQAMTSDTVLTWTSEGTTITGQPADLAALENRLRQRSQITAMQPRTMEYLALPPTPGSDTPRSSLSEGGVITNRS